MSCPAAGEKGSWSQTLCSLGHIRLHVWDVLWTWPVFRQEKGSIILTSAFLWGRVYEGPTYTVGVWLLPVSSPRAECSSIFMSLSVIWILLVLPLICFLVPLWNCNCSLAKWADMSCLGWDFFAWVIFSLSLSWILQAWWLLLILQRVGNKVLPADGKVPILWSFQERFRFYILAPST